VIDLSRPVAQQLAGVLDAPHAVQQGVIGKRVR
jgi:hypothetical protein